MAYRVIGTDAFTTTFAVDSSADIQNLPTNVGQGSMAILCESADGSGTSRTVYMLNSSGQWVK